MFLKKLSPRTLLKKLSPRTLFSLTPSSSPSPYSLYSIAQCSTSPSHLTYPHSHSQPDSRNVGGSVWWDIENCDVPSGLNVVRGAQAITAAIQSSGIKGPMQITAFGDMLRLSRTNPEAYNSTLLNFPAFKFSHVPPGGEDSADRRSSLRMALTIDLMDWLCENPPPAHLFLISGDTHFANILHRSRLKNYNVLLASKEPVHCVLCCAATVMWDWDALIREENLSGRHFNQPPDSSWYGHYEGPLEDPFTAIHRPALFRDMNENECKLDDHEVFSQDSFWTDVQTFINTDLGSLILAESKNRGNLAYNLREYGPSVLRSVTKSDVCIMVDKLIEKKLVVETECVIKPFKRPEEV